MSDEQFLHLTTLYLEDAIDAADLELLNRELANSPERVRQFNDLRMLTGLICEHGRAVETAPAVDLNANGSPETASINSPTHDSESNKASRFQPSRRTIAIVLAGLAIVASLFIVLNWSGVYPQRDSTSTIATLAYTSHAKWGSEERDTGDELGKGKLKLEVGLARLDFRNGASVTIQGPAELEIVSTDRIVLSSGILTASIPDSAVGFEVVTPAMDVVDLGTAFGISVGADGETDVCVFEGEVEVSRPATEDEPVLSKNSSEVQLK